jgi:hypothetical protein
LHELQRSQSGSEREERNAMRAPQKCDAEKRLDDRIPLVGMPLFFIVEVEL